MKTGWCVYILRCRDGTLYTGVTNDLDRRLRAHEKGTASRYTRSCGPVALVYREASRGRSRALRREARIKRLNRVEKLLLIHAGRGALPCRHESAGEDAHRARGGLTRTPRARPPARGGEATGRRRRRGRRTKGR